MMATLILWSHALAALVFGGLGVAQLRGGAGQWPHGAFVTALFATSLWALAVAGIDAGHVAPRIAESVRNIAWLGFMLALVRRDRAGNFALGTVYLLVVAIAVMSALLAIAEMAPIDREAVVAVGTARLVFRMMTAVSALVLVHHLYQAAPASRGGIRLVMLALGAMWGADLVLLTLYYFQADWVSWLSAVRGMAMVGVAAVLMIAVHRSGDWTLALSRPVTIRALTAIGIVLYVGIVALATSLAGSYAGPYSRIAQTAIVFGATTTLMTMLSTPWLRAWTKVKIAKHLFRHRYDYRAEWQRFTDTLGMSGTQFDGHPEPLGTRVVKAVADLTDSPGGLLLVPDGASLEVSTTWNWRDTTESGGEALARYLGDGARIIELDPVRTGDALHEEQASVPTWLSDCRDAWAIVPLLHGGNLVGAIVLARPPVDRALDWEDFDLLRVAGRQAASYLAEDRAHTALADAARFDEFNRRFAFILHDIKNLVSQLTLVARNAERHADNPDFRVDMIATLKDSSDRMNALLARLSQHNAAPSEPLQPVDVGALVERIVAARKSQHPIAARVVPALALGHATRLEQVLGHLVQNGIEASGVDDPIMLSIDAQGDRVRIDVVDQGCGMTPGFVRDQLFRPFVSSKPTGFGIGAFEARQLVQAMGGTLEVTSREGQGTRFRILLPAATAMEAAA
ncbi:XrtA/PEP-CTERM system histidine kinase PrsK [Sphingomonas sp. CFBP 13728]|uniref:XrtA/PEP-CTERM system histidine kinase PrsK n=1 Tax=Sphingomonas sp. CFBP 13728 TaxID=2775294 RepID=UPI001FCE93CE|nr:XrtA/PEP-CTERM system histidine kinase PrsK [Sphingomonas sp. CFBP 13728]